MLHKWPYKIYPYEKNVSDDGDPSSKAMRKRRHGLTNSLAPSKGTLMTFFFRKFVNFQAFQFNKTNLLGAMKNLQKIDEEKNPHRYTAPSLPKNAKFKEFP